jgi:hypothetical protein
MCHTRTRSWLREVGTILPYDPALARTLAMAAARIAPMPRWLAHRRGS